MKWRLERSKSTMGLVGSRMATALVKQMEAKQSEFEERRKVFENAIELLKESGDKTLREIYQSKIQTNRMKEIKMAMKSGSLTPAGLRQMLMLKTNTDDGEISKGGGLSKQPGGGGGKSTGRKRQGGVKVHERLLKNRGGISKLEMELTALSLMK